jgi:hypothetical protein
MGTIRLVIIAIFLSVLAVANANPIEMSSDLYAKPVATAQEKTFVQALKVAISNNDKHWVATHVLYPITEDINGRAVEIKNSTQFEKRYNDIITGNVKNAVITQDLNNLFTNSQGVMIGNGQIWILTANYVKGKPPSVLIITINNDM